MQHQQSVTNPRVPYVGPVWKNLVPGSMIRIQGEVPPTADRFNINLHCGSPLSDVAFHLSVRLLQNYIARNAMLDDSWGDEEDSGILPIVPGQAFEILILCDSACYKVAINGSHFCEFRHRAPFQKVTHVVIDGEVSLHLVAYEDAAGSPGGSAPPPNYGDDSSFFGPPRSPKPKPRRPPTPPRPEEEESGFEHFLETAGTIIAGAIATGAASSIIDSLTGHGHDQQQQQRYQRPPSPQPPLQSLLLGGGGNQQGGQQGIGGAVGSILGSVAEQILRPKEHHQ